MPWTLKKDTLFDKDGSEILYFLPTASQQERFIIHSGSGLIDLVGEFVVSYDEGKKQVSKKLFDQFTKLIDINANYKRKWRVNQEGELYNEKDQVIGIFVESRLYLANIISNLPELYDAAQDLIKALSSTKGLELKKVYNKICDYYDKT